MVNVKVVMKTSGEPVERIPVSLHLDNIDRAMAGQTDRNGVAAFTLTGASGQVLVDGRSLYQGRLDRDILVELWSMVGGSDDATLGEH